MGRFLHLLALLPLALGSGMNAAPSKAVSAQTISAEEKAQVRNYGLVVLMPQTMIETSFDTGRVAAAPAGGLIDALIVSSMDNKRQVMAKNLQDKADRTVTPLRAAIAGFDIDSLAVRASEKALSAVPWIARQSTTLSKTVAPMPTGPRFARIRFSYDLSPDFSAIRLFTQVDFAREGMTKDGKGTGKFTSFYAQSITSIVQLRERSYEASENVATWSAEDGKQAKAAFEQAFASVERLLPYALELSAADIKAFTAKEREHGFGAGYNGPLIQRGGVSADDILIWNNGLLFVHTLP